MSVETVPDELVEKAARVLFKRLKYDMGIKEPWHKLTPDDKQAFRDDVLAVREALIVNSPEWAEVAADAMARFGEAFEQMMAGRSR